MLNDETLSKQTGAVSDRDIQYHHMKTNPLKKDKLIEVQRHIISNLTNLATQQKQFDSGKELVEATLSSDDEDQEQEVDFVLTEIGSSSSAEEEESDENNYDNSSRVATVSLQDQREEQHAFCYKLL